MRLVAIALGALVLCPCALGGGVPPQVVVAGGGVWTAGDGGLRVLGGPRLPTSCPYPLELARTAGAVWVGSVANGYAAGAVDRFDARTGRRTRSVRFPHRAVYALAGGGALAWAWLASPSHLSTSVVVAFAPDGLVVHRLTVARRPAWLAADADGAWLTDGTRVELLRGDGARMPVAGIGRVTAQPVAAFGSVWFPSGFSLVRVDSRTRRPVARIRLGSMQPLVLAAGGRRLWVAGSAGPARSALVSLRPDGARAGPTRILAGTPTGLAATGDRVYVAEGEFPSRLLVLDAHSLRVVRVIRT